MPFYGNPSKTDYLTGLFSSTGEIVVIFEMYSYDHLMSRLVCFLVDLVDTCVDLDTVISFFYERRIIYN